MKKLLCFVVLFLYWAPYGKGQFLEISQINGPNLCCGYGKENMACVMINRMPPLGNQTDQTIVYTWYAKHEKGLRTWHTATAGRWVPLPWPGTYEVWVVVQYVNTKTRTAYAAFLSNSVILNAHHCEDPKPSEGNPKN